MGINRIFTEMIHCLLLLLAALPLHLWPPQEARMTVLETERRDVKPYIWFRFVLS